MFAYRNTNARKFSRTYRTIIFAILKDMTLKLGHLPTFKVLFKSTLKFCYRVYNKIKIKITVPDKEEFPTLKEPVYYVDKRVLVSIKCTTLRNYHLSDGKRATRGFAAR